MPRRLNAKRRSASGRTSRSQRNFVESRDKEKANLEDKSIQSGIVRHVLPLKMMPSITCKERGEIASWLKPRCKTDTICFFVCFLFLFFFLKKKDQSCFIWTNCLIRNPRFALISLNCSSRVPFRPFSVETGFYSCHKTTDRKF